MIHKKKRISWIVNFTVQVDHELKFKQKKKTNKYLDLARELKNAKEHKSGDDTSCNWCAWNGLQRLDKGAEMLYTHNTYT